MLKNNLMELRCVSSNLPSSWEKKTPNHFPQVRYVVPLPSWKQPSFGIRGHKVKITQQPKLLKKPSLDTCMHILKEKGFEISSMSNFTL